MAKYLVVGGSKGIGAAIAESLIQRGHDVVVFSRTQPEQVSVEWFQIDVTTTTSFPEIDKLDGIVYCPGSINLKPINRLSADDFLNDLTINFLSAVKVFQHYLSVLKKSDSASVIFFSTVAVSQGMPFHASISAAKAALEGFAKSAAAELAPVVRMNVVAPSLTDTPLASHLLNTDVKKENAANRHPLKRVGNVSDIAAATVYLLCDAKWITGQTLHVDGGLSTLRV
jgi:NAD(P)-dependent dehydrogenase (short-subunit alcohol dehydrogenase family)